MRKMSKTENFIPYKFPAILKLKKTRKNHYLRSIKWGSGMVEVRGIDIAPPVQFPYGTLSPLGGWQAILSPLKQ